MSDPREEYGQQDPWGEFEEDQAFAGDHIYGGPHEEIQDLILLTNVCIKFELWADDFRWNDRMGSKTPVSRWEEDSPFSELQSVKLASTEARKES